MSPLQTRTLGGVFFGLIFSMLGLVLCAMALPTKADCTPPFGSTGDDVIYCTVHPTPTIFAIAGDAGNDQIIIESGTILNGVSGDTFGLPAAGGNDTITNDGIVNGGIYGDSNNGDGSGDDTIVNNGSADDLYGDTDLGNGSGDDTIVNNGVTNNIYGDEQAGTGTGSDNITNNGTVNNNISAGGGNDTVTIGANTAQVGGTIDGGADYDVLTFNVTSASPEQLQSWADQIYAANPNGGTIILAGHTYTWTNFEELTQLLFSLARINGVADPFAVYCSLDDGIDVYAIVGDEGVFSLHISGSVISGGIEQAVDSGNLVEIGSSPDAMVYATTSGELQLNAPSGFNFTFTFQTYCGALPPPSETEPIVEEEELPAFSIINQPYGG